MLITLKAESDAGNTAKLMHPVNRPGGTMLTIRIKLERIEGGSGYAWQYVTLGNTVQKTRPPHTVFHPSWAALLKDIEGMQTVTSDWIVCEDALEPSVLERKTVSERNKERLPLLLSFS